MNNPEARFILGAYRPDGRDAGDATFAEAVAQAECDPALRAWWENERQFDAGVSRRLAEIAPPAGLREAILAGVRASQPQRRWWERPVWLAAAAGVAVLLSMAVVLSRGRSPNLHDLAELALRDLAEAHGEHVGHPPRLADVQGQLAALSGPVTSALKLELADLRNRNCRTVRIAGREVFEVCFQRDGTWFHLYAARRSDFAGEGTDPHALLATRGEFASTAWTDSENVYALVTRAGSAALRRVI